MNLWSHVGVGCHLMALALFLSGVMSWHTWSANVHITDMWMPLGTISIDIWNLERRTAPLGDHDAGPWVVGIALIVGALLVWRQCEMWRHAGAAWRGPPA